MLYFDRINVSEGIDINKTSTSKVWYLSLLVFLNKGFKFQTYVCNRCHDLLMLSMNLNNIAIFKIKNGDYRCIITETSKSEAINLIKNTD